jgi:Brp/Blh family beta-carotene 15,15'-monooxygenase
MKANPLLLLMRASSLLVVVLSASCAGWMDQFVLPVSLVLILVLGIPHGATDHRMFYSLADTQQRGAALQKKWFYVYYIGLMLLCGVVWYFFPISSFLLFLLVSAYHFGQLNLNTTEWTESPLKQMTSVVSGLFVLSVPLMSHADVAIPIVESMLHLRIPAAEIRPYFTLLALCSGFCYGAFLLILSLTNRAPRKVLLRELVNWMFLFALFYYAPLLLGFSVYFSIWHALPSMRDQVAFYRQRQPDYRLKNYVLEMLPYSLLSLSVLLFCAQFISEKPLSEQLALLFAGIAMVTLPHVLLMDWLYSMPTAITTAKRETTSCPA